jgi:hypothetical protein
VNREQSLPVLQKVVIPLTATESCSPHFFQLHKIPHLNLFTQYQHHGFQAIGCRCPCFASFGSLYLELPTIVCTFAIRLSCRKANSCTALGLTILWKLLLHVAASRPTSAPITLPISTLVETRSGSQVFTQRQPSSTVALSAHPQLATGPTFCHQKMLLVLVITVTHRFQLHHPS